MFPPFSREPPASAGQRVGSRSPEARGYTGGAPTRASAPGAGIEPAGACFRGRCSVPAATPPALLFFRRDTGVGPEVRGEGVEPSPAESKAADLPLVDPRECPVGVEPTCPDVASRYLRR